MILHVMFVMALLPAIIQPNALEGIYLLKGIHDFEEMTPNEFYENLDKISWLPKYIGEISKDLEDIGDFYHLSFVELRAGKTKKDRIFRIREY
jgi:hypothetical protein